MHGGKSKIKHGLYSRYKQGRLAAAAERHITDPRVKDLRDEVGILRAMLEEQLEDDNRAGIVAIIDVIRKTVSSLVQIEEGLKLTLDVSQVQAMMAQVVAIIREEVRDPDTIGSIATRIRALQALPRPLAERTVGE